MTIFEIWAEDANGHRYLVDSTNNHPQARRIAQNNLSEEFPQAVILQEVAEEETIEVDRLTR